MDTYLVLPVPFAIAAMLILYSYACALPLPLAIALQYPYQPSFFHLPMKSAVHRQECMSWCTIDSLLLQDAAGATGGVVFTCGI